MKLDRKHCYQVIRARDSRYDGLFFTAVKTTQIYCRPVCPARTPLQKNVEFFETASEAEGNGYRPCLRCRPETAPGSPVWRGTSATVTRAIRLIHEGNYFEDGCEQLASRLGVSTRHLNRLFKEHIGISAGSLSRTLRMQTAVLLVKNTKLPMAEIAPAAGFNSLRRFNDAIKKTYRKSPSELRKLDMSGSDGKESFQVRLSYREPFEWDFFKEYLSGRAAAGVEHIDGDSYQRSVVIDGKPYHIQVAQDADSRCLLVTLPRELSGHVFWMCEKIRDIFDLRCDPEVIRSQLTQHRHMKKILKSHQFKRVPGSWDPFELAVRTILGQQISVKAATTIAGRVVKRLGTQFASGSDMITHCFPTPRQILGGNLDGVGLSSRRIDTLKGLAELVLKEDVFKSYQDFDSFKTTLKAVKGIGDWTAEYICMRALRDPDSFPASDLAILKVLSKGGEKPKPKEVLSRSTVWQPWRSYATFLLWASY